MSNPEFVEYLIGTFSYLGIFVIISFGGIVIPLPEEVLLLLVGYVSALGYSALLPAILVGIAGVLAGDSALYALSRSQNRYIAFITSRLNPARLARYQEQMKLHTGKTLFLLRFVVGLRFFGPIVAGVMQITWLKFIFFDTLAALIYVPFFVLLGYHFQSRIVWLIGTVEVVRHALFLGLAFLIGIIISYGVLKKFFNGSRTSPHE